MRDTGTSQDFRDVFDLSSRVAVITGGCGLLGMRHAAAIAAFGGVPVLVDIKTDRSELRPDAVAGRFGPDARLLEADITRPESVAALCERILRLYGRVDVLINNAANNPKMERADDIEFSRLEHFPIAQWDADLAAGTHSGTSPGLQISSGGTYYLFAKLDSTNVIYETDETNNVAQAPNPVVVSGPVILDNGQSGYTESGPNWTDYTGEGYNNNEGYAPAGTGANTATWELTGLAAGGYEVQMTWLAKSNRATNATYQIYDGNTLLNTVQVDQTQGAHRRGHGQRHDVPDPGGLHHQQRHAARRAVGQRQQLRHRRCDAGRADLAALTRRI